MLSTILHDHHQNNVRLSLAVRKYREERQGKRKVGEKWLGNRSWVTRITLVVLG